MTDKSNYIGSRGEAICVVLLTRPGKEGRRLFSPQFLGDKFPTVDYLVELLHTGEPIRFFFIQVKSTSLGYTKNKRLKVQVSREDRRRMASFPAPTYIIGIDEQAETGYIISANEDYNQPVSSMSTQFPLTYDTLELLWKEVNTFWNQHDMQFKNSMFVPQKEAEDDPD